MIYLKIMHILTMQRYYFLRLKSIPAIGKKYSFINIEGEGNQIAVQYKDRFAKGTKSQDGTG